MGSLFASKIHELRNANGLTLEELASKIGSSKGYLSGIETAHRRPPSDKIVCKLARSLCVDRKILLRLAHIDKMPEDIRQDMKLSAVAMPSKFVHMLEDEAALLSDSIGDNQKGKVYFPAGYIPVLNHYQEEGLSSLKNLLENAKEYIQVNIPGLYATFALRIGDTSMQRKRGISFDEGSLVFFSSITRIRPCDCLFVVYHNERGLSTLFRCVGECNRRRVRLIPLKSHYCKDTVLPRQSIEKVWKAVAQLKTIV
jgi:transcriptional regulator with XRE-family HTH domain